MRKPGRMNRSDGRSGLDKILNCWDVLMKSRERVLLFVSVLVVGMVSAVSAMASYTSGDWLWQGTSVALTNISASASSFKKPSDFDLKFLTNQTVNLVHHGHTGPITYPNTSNNNYSSPVTQFKFQFIDNGSTFADYSVNISNLRNGYYTYTLTETGGRGEVVSFKSSQLYSLTSSPVPIPGSALLLGSGLLGLLGIGSRKYKA